MTDLVIRGGTVLDGTGAPGRRADVAIRGDRIEAIGANLRGRRELDASGQVVAPGFIDIHTHYDAQVFWDPALTPSCFHGVTTVVAGNCGFSLAPTRPAHRDVVVRTLEKVEDMNAATLGAGIPWDFESFGEYLGSVRRRGTILNFTGYVGHTALRLYALGAEAYDRAATPAEVEVMCTALREGLEAGAAGLATSFAPPHIGMNGRPVPSRLCDRAEFETLCRVVGAFGRGVIHVAPGQPIGIPDLYPLQRAIGRPITYAALLTFPGIDYRALAELNAKERAAGAQVFPQVSPRPLTFEINMEDPFSFAMAPSVAGLIGKPREHRIACYRDAAWRTRAEAELEGIVLRPRWETFSVSEHPDRPELEGKPLAALARERGLSPFDALCALSIEADLRPRFRQTLGNDDVEGVAWLLTREGCVLGLSDAGAHVGQLCDAPLPTDLLGRWVRERGVMPLEQAVHKLTGEPAALFGLEDRGALRPGAFADVVVFDPATVEPGPTRRVRDFPADAQRLTADAPRGMTHLLVNGVPIREDGVPLHASLETRPGVVGSGHEASS
jgi:N-acyl-D-aspartate/D-glutamate deacylase